MFVIFYFFALGLLTFLPVLYFLIDSFFSIDFDCLIGSYDFQSLLNILTKNLITNLRIMMIASKRLCTEPRKKTTKQMMVAMERVKLSSEM